MQLHKSRSAKVAAGVVLVAVAFTLGVYVASDDQSAPTTNAPGTPASTADSTSAASESTQADSTSPISESTQADSTSAGSESTQAAPPTVPGPGTASLVNGVFTDTFDGKPGSPKPWHPDGWDVTVHSRDANTWEQLDPVGAMHGSDCGAPPATHEASSYDQAVFQCKDHVMTTMNSTGYGLIYLTPDVIADFSNGTATIKFDVSTLRTSSRDWWDVWITPFAENLQLAIDTGFPDLSGPPKDAIHIRLESENVLSVGIIRDFSLVQFPDYPNDRVTGDWFTGYNTFLKPDAARRDTVEIQISKNHLKVGMPQHNFFWVDSAIPALNFGSGIVQFGQHSYNPTKDCGDGTIPGPDGKCTPNTWHWDNVSIAPATPFTMIKADRRSVSDHGARSVQFATPAPANSFLRFAATGTIEVSVDEGATWQGAVLSPIQKPSEDDGGFHSYWTPVTAGTNRVMFRGQGSWQGPWNARDISVWSLEVPTR